MRTFKIYSLSNFQIHIQHSIINCSHHYILRTCFITRSCTIWPPLPGWGWGMSGHGGHKMGEDGLCIKTKSKWKLFGTSHWAEWDLYPTLVYFQQSLSSLDESYNHVNIVMFHFLCENLAVSFSAGAKGYFLDHRFSLDFDNDPWMLLFGSFIRSFLPLKNGLST